MGVKGLNVASDVCVFYFFFIIQLITSTHYKTTTAKYTLTLRKKLQHTYNKLKIHRKINAKKEKKKK